MLIQHHTTNASANQLAPMVAPTPAVFMLLGESVEPAHCCAKCKVLELIIHVQCLVRSSWRPHLSSGSVLRRSGC